MSIAVPRGYRTDRTDLPVLTEEILAAARARRLELEAAEIAERICARLDGVPKDDLPENADVTASPFRLAYEEYLHDQAQMSPTYALEDPQRFTVQVIEDGTGLALFGVWMGDKYHETIMSVPGVQDVRFSNSTDSWPEGVPYEEQLTRQDYWVALLGSDRASDRGTAIELGMPNDPGINLAVRLQLVVDHQPDRDSRAVDVLYRAIAEEATRRLRQDAGLSLEGMISVINESRRTAWNRVGAVSGIEPLTVEVAGGTAPAPPRPVIVPESVSAAAAVVISELHGGR